MSGQKILNPADQHTTGQWSPSGPIPPPLRQFGRFPNVRDWFPGDLLLFSAVHPNWISKSIIRGQENGGYAAEDARWHHVAVYLGDGISICEATSTGVHHAPIYPYLGEYLLRVRRDPTHMRIQRPKQLTPGTSLAEPGPVAPPPQGLGGHIGFPGRALGETSTAQPP